MRASRGTATRPRPASCGSWQASSPRGTAPPSSAQIDVPTLVIHGDRDRMVHPTGGAATARAIPGARLETIVGLGHDLPIGAWGRVIDLITDHSTSRP